MATETKVEAVAWQYRLTFGDDRSWRTALGSLNPDYDRDRYEIRALVPQSALDALRGEVERLRADARRYRYLRDNAHPDSDEGFAVTRECMSDWGKWYSLHVSGASLDEEIDALTKETP